MNKEENNQGRRYLLILSCSKRKKPISKAPAIELEYMLLYLEDLIVIRGEVFTTSGH